MYIKKYIKICDFCVLFIAFNRKQFIYDLITAHGLNVNPFSNITNCTAILIFSFDSYWKLFLVAVSKSNV